MRRRRDSTRRMHWARTVRGLGAALLLAPLRLSAQDDGREALRTGKYQEAIAVLSKVPQSDSGWMDAQRDLVRAYMTVGKLDDAERVARRGTSARGGRALWNPLGEVLLARGQRAAAESAFVRAGAEHAPDSLTAALNLAVLHYDRGDRARAMKEFDRFIDVYNATAGAGLESDELVAVATDSGNRPRPGSTCILPRSEWAARSISSDSAASSRAASSSASAGSSTQTKLER